MLRCWYPLSPGCSNLAELRRGGLFARERFRTLSGRTTLARSVRPVGGRGLCQRQVGMVFSPRYFLANSCPPVNCVRISLLEVVHARIPSSVEGRGEQPAASG